MVNGRVVALHWYFPLYIGIMWCYMLSSYRLSQNLIFDNLFNFIWNHYVKLSCGCSSMVFSSLYWYNVVLYVIFLQTFSWKLIFENLLYFIWNHYGKLSSGCFSMVYFSLYWYFMPIYGLYSADLFDDKECLKNLFLSCILVSYADMCAIFLQTLSIFHWNHHGKGCVKKPLFLKV